jgi:Dyp-type peroxidase family
MATLDLNLEDRISRLANQLARVPESTPMRARIETEDIQGIVFRGYGQLRHACYPLLRIADGNAAAARRWLGTLLPIIASGKPGSRDSALQIAFSHAGLCALGLHEDTRRGFAREFTEGMTTDHRRRLLGDSGLSHPDCWRWGGPKNEPVHVALLLYARTPDALASLHGRLRSAWTAAGLSAVATLDTGELASQEHFGFADGISQPAIEGYHASKSKLHRVKAGEFVLGYPNEYGLYTDRPLVPAARDPRAILPLDVGLTPQHDFGSNGTYLVVRQLHQDVPEFRAMLDALSKNPDGSPNPSARERLAAQMVGRWPSGASLMETPERDDPTLASANEFRYHQGDPEGLKCPIGAHVRRANPRDALPPMPGTEASLEVNRHHRLIRRGRSYGAPLAPGQVDKADRGIVMLIVNANIARQFEFVQHSWLNDPHFNGLYNEADPLVGATDHNEFVVPGTPLGTRCTGLPRFVSVVGGGYFFVPGLRALRYLAEINP